MRKKGLTIVELAIIAVPGFEKVVSKLEQQVSLRGQSQSTLQNYIRRIALFVLHFERLPENIEEEEINEYLAALARDPRSPSRSSFKHMVYGLRYYYRLLGMNKRAIALPSLKRNTKLLVILNRQELKELFRKPKLLKMEILHEFNALIEQAWDKKWVVHCEPSMAKAEHVIRYLGQYTHRVAITNQRILDVSKTKVTFIAKDYRDRAIKKPVTIHGIR